MANLPYYISTPLLFTLLEAHVRINRMVLMLQAEVAERIVAAPNTDAYGILSVLTQYRAAATIAFSVFKKLFSPPTGCRFLRPHPHAAHTPFDPASHEAAFIKVVRAAFAHRRKTCANSLRDEGFSPPHLAEAFAQTTINPTRRAETLSIDEFAALAKALEASNSG